MHDQVPLSPVTSQAVQGPVAALTAGMPMAEAAVSGHANARQLSKPSRENVTRLRQTLQDHPLAGGPLQADWVSKTKWQLLLHDVLCYITAFVQRQGGVMATLLLDAKLCINWDLRQHPCSDATSSNLQLKVCFDLEMPAVEQCCISIQTVVNAVAVPFLIRISVVHLCRGVGEASWQCPPAHQWLFSILTPRPLQMAGSAACHCCQGPVCTAAMPFTTKFAAWKNTVILHAWVDACT